MMLNDVGYITGGELNYNRRLIAAPDDSAVLIPTPLKPSIRHPPYLNTSIFLIFYSNILKGSFRFLFRFLVMAAAWMRPTEFQWLQFLDKLSSSTPTLWLQYLDRLVRTQVPELEFDSFFVLTSHNQGPADFCVHIIDSKNVHKYPLPSLEPIIRFGYPVPHEAFAIVGFTLYMFGGMTCDRYGAKWTNKMSFYDMRKAIRFGTTIDLISEESIEEWEGEDNVVDNLETGPEMAVGKCWPVAVVVAEFKICVFSPVLYSKPQKKIGYTFPLVENYLMPNFEVYDTRNGSWTALEEPFDDYNKLDPKLVTLSVDSHCVHRSSFIIQTILGIYGINLDNPNPKWVKMDGSEGIQKFPFPERWSIVDKQLCDPFEAVRLEDLESHPIAVKNSSTDRESLIRQYQTGFLCVRDIDYGCIDLCRVRGGLAYYDYLKHEDIPNLLVDLFKFDAEAGYDLCEWKEIKSHKSFTFSLTSNTCVGMRVLGCFPIKGMDTLKQNDTSKDCIWQKIKDLKHIGLQWVDIANKVALESGAHSLYFATSHTKGGKGVKYFTGSVGISAMASQEQEQAERL